MLACRLTTILPAMTLPEALKTTRIPRVAGRTGDRTACVNASPPSVSIDAGCAGLTISSSRAVRELLRGHIATDAALIPVSICAPARSSLCPSHVPSVRVFEDRGRGGTVASLLPSDAVQASAARPGPPPTGSFPWMARRHRRDDGRRWTIPSRGPAGFARPGWQEEPPHQTHRDPVDPVCRAGHACGGQTGPTPP
jgi:hypothetical protein